MTTTALERQTESEDRVPERELVDFILRNWKFMSWTELLSSDVELSLKLGRIPLAEIAGFRIVHGELRLEGREDATRVLKAIYDELRDNFFITTKVINGSDLILAGRLVIPTTRENADSQSFPIVIAMTFAAEGKVARMAIVQFDLLPLADAIRDAALNGGGLVDVSANFSQREKGQP